MPTLSIKGQQLPASPIRKLVPYAEKAKARGVEVLHLNIGQPDIAAPEEAMKIVRNQQLELLPYGTSQGSKSIVRNFAPIMPSTIFPSIPMTSS